MGSAVSPEHRGYKLVLRKDGRTFQFMACSVSDALQQAKAVLPPGESASLFEDEAPLAQVSCSSEGFWSVEPLPLAVLSRK